MTTIYSTPNAKRYWRRRVWAGLGILACLIVLASALAALCYVYSASARVIPTLICSGLLVIVSAAAILTSNTVLDDWSSLRRIVG